MIAQIVFVVWRESVEALLVVGILHAWLAHNSRDKGGMRYLWGGVASGVAVALGLSVLLVKFSEALPAGWHDYFQAALILIACALIIQMVFWMRRHGRTMKRQMEQELSQSVETGRWWGIFLLALAAIAREGSETVIFLYGIVAAGAPGHFAQTALAIVLAIGAAFASYWLLQYFSRHMSWRMFFRLTEILLLCLGSALLVTGADYLVSFGVLPYTQPLWNTGFLLNDTSSIGSLISSLSGYRSEPDAVTVTAWLLYWIGIAIAFRLEGAMAARQLTVKAAE
jgi:high-affinity iron transporter